MRYSSHNQTENSIEYQRTVIQRYCTENQLEIVKEYIDEAYTATNDQRPQFQQMMHDAWEKPEWSTILVYDYSRFARNTDDATIYTGMLDNTKTNLISVTQPFTESIEGTLLKHIIHAINEFQSQVISKHTHDGLRNYANKTQHCGGIPPLGYDVGEDRTLVINEEEAKIVKDIFDMYECGYSYNKMKDELNAKGCRTKVGELFTKHSFKDILRQEKYTGLYTWDKRVGKDRKGKHNSHEHKPLDKQVRIENGCPQIIDQEQFERVQKKMNARADGAADSKARHHYMLGGLQKIRCAECGSTMQGTKCTSHGKEYFTYFCPKHKAKECSTRAIRTEAIDCFVTGVLMRDLYYRDDLQAISASMKQTNEVKALQEKLKGNKKATQNILKAIQ
jgi:site-specific DNA recombinase